MKVLQLIDSLRPGGAEKMAVNIANALLPHVDKSFLCCTRQEGMLKEEIKTGVGYLFLNKNTTFDPKAFLKLRKYILENNIDFVHAHSTSFFLASLLKLTGIKYKLIWHDHYGESEYLEQRKFTVLKKFSRLFNGIICVNTSLKNWALQKLNCKNVIEIKNFVPDPDLLVKAKIQLKGGLNDFKIICVANLRPQKDHFNLIEAFEIVEPKHRFSLHLVGEDPKTEYSASVLAAIKKSPVKHKIFYYGSQSRILQIIKQAHLGILASRSEGLPLALIEYGLGGIPVICTDVGQCADIIGGNGRVVPPGNPSKLAEEILDYSKNYDNALEEGKFFHTTIAKKFSEKMLIKNYISFYLKVNF